MDKQSLRPQDKDGVGCAIMHLEDKLRERRKHPSSPFSHDRTNSGVLTAIEWLRELADMLDIDEDTPNGEVRDPAK